MRARAAAWILLGAAAAAGAWYLATPRRARGPESVDEAAPPEVLPPVEPQTAPLVVRLRTSDGRALPGGAQAGYLLGNVEKVHVVDENGAARFPDAPVGSLRTIGKATGFRLGFGTVQVIGGVANESSVTIEPEPASTEAPPSGSTTPPNEGETPPPSAPGPPTAPGAPGR